MRRGPQPLVMVGGAGEWVQGVLGVTRGEQARTGEQRHLGPGGVHVVRWRGAVPGVIAVHLEITISG